MAKMIRRVRLGWAYVLVSLLDLWCVTVLAMHGRDAGDEGSWRAARTVPELGRPERLPDRVGGSGAVIRVRVLGKPEIGGVPADLHVRKLALEFLTYLIVCGGRAHPDAIIGDLIPESPPSKALQRMHTYAYNLRQIFARLGGDGGYLRVRRHWYVLDRAGFDVDLWSMLDAVADAKETSDQQARVAALRRTVDAYTGPLADGAGYLWLAGPRDEARREYVDAVLALADILAGPARAVLAEGRERHPDDERLSAALNGFAPTR
jgi:DNA-binding SARP family transcriptional activator